MSYLANKETDEFGNVDTIKRRQDESLSDYAWRRDIEGDEEYNFNPLNRYIEDNVSNSESDINEQNLMRTPDSEEREQHADKKAGNFSEKKTKNKDLENKTTKLGSELSAGFDIVNYRQRTSRNTGTDSELEKWAKVEKFGMNYVDALQDFESKPLYIASEHKNAGHLNKDYWKRIGFCSFELIKGKKPSDAVEAIFEGPKVRTRLDCASMALAVYYRALLKVLGKEEFNNRYQDNMVILQTDREKVLKELTLFRSDEELNEMNKQNTKDYDSLIQAGDWVYFKNDSSYSRKHPNGSWRGENTFCIGKENGKNIYNGFESGKNTEIEMRELLKKQYDLERTKMDRYIIIDRIKESIVKRGIVISKEEEYWLDYAKRNNELLDEWIKDQLKKYSNSTFWHNIFNEYHSESNLVPKETSLNEITITYIARPSI